MGSSYSKQYTKQWQDSIVIVSLHQDVINRLNELNKPVERAESITNLCSSTKPCYMCYLNGVMFYNINSKGLYWSHYHNLITSEKYFQKTCYRFCFHGDYQKVEELEDILSNINIDVKTEYSPITAVILASFSEKNININIQQNIIAVLFKYGFNANENDRKLAKLFVYDNMPKSILSLK
jgi:hypothetical protein